MLLAPVASASPLYTFSAPYTHMNRSQGNSLSTYGCQASASEPVTGFFSEMTGKYTTEALTSAGHCSGSFDNYAAVYTSVGLLGPAFHIMKTGVYKVAALWKVDYTANVGAIVQPATSNPSQYTYSYAYADVSIWAYEYVVEAGTGSYVVGTGPWYNNIANWYVDTTSSISASVGPSSFGTVEWAHLSAGHYYETELFLYVDVYAETYASSGLHDSAWANLDLATGGTGAWLQHIVVA